MGGVRAVDVSVEISVDERIDCYLREARRLVFEEGLSFLVYLIEMAMVERLLAKPTETPLPVTRPRLPKSPRALAS